MTEIIVALITGLAGIIGTIITANLGAQAKRQKKEIKNSLAQKEVINRLKAQLSKKNLLILVGGGFSVVFMLLTVYLLFFKSKWDLESKVADASEEMVAIINRGMGKREYVIPSISMNVVLDSVEARLQADITITYHVVYLTDTIDKTKAFYEEYTLNRGGEIINFIGSDKVHPGGKKNFWYYEYDIANGSQRSTVSHFRVLYPKNKFEKAPRKPDYLKELSNTNEEVFQYPNDQGDIIGELLITVSSSTLTLKPPVYGDAVIGIPKGEKPRNSFLPEFYSSEKGRYSSIVARFKNINDSEVATLLVGWK